MVRVFLATIAVATGLGAQTAAQPVDGTPLLRAKLAFEMARARVLENRFADAGTTLRDAAQALADYQRDFPGPHAETAQFIRGEIEQYGARIERNHEDALDRIDLWRLPVERWYADLHRSARR